MMKFTQRAITGLALASLLFVMIQVRECRAEELSPWTHDHPNITLDAFNMSRCGNANFQDWQRNQSAFGFKSGKLNGSPAGQLVEDNRIGGSISPRISNGRNAMEGEFPWFVELTLVSPRGSGFCGGTLVHNDLVITAAHCVVGATGFKLTFGSNTRHNPDAVTRSANKWCWPTRFEGGPYVKVKSPDLAVIRLAKPVGYKQGKIGPACLWPRGYHASDAICTLSGLGPVDANKTQAASLQAKDFRRVGKRRDDEYLSSYQAEDNGAACSGDSGSPLVCYDSSVDDPAVVKAFAVGALSGGLGGCLQDERYISWVADFFLHKDDLAGLLEEIQGNGGGDREKFTCMSPV